MRERARDILITIHEPSSIRRNVGLVDMEIEVSEELHDFKKYAMPVGAVHLSEENKRRRL